MDLILIEKFLQEMMPPKGKNSVNTTFACLRQPSEEHVIGTMRNFITGLARDLAFASDELIQAQVVRHVVTGIVMAMAASNPHRKKELIENFLDSRAKERGEHVIDFHNWKAGK